MKGTLGGVALLLCSLATPSAAQVASPLRANWFMKDLRSGMCVQFLVSPGAAQHEAGGLPVVPIERVAERFPALARVAAAEATYQGWVPAEYCWFLYRSAVVKGKVVENDRGSRPVMIGYLAIEGEGLPDSATAIAVSVFTNMSPLSSALNQARLQVDRIDFTIGPIPTEESSLTRSRYEAQHSGATVHELG